MKCQSQYPSAFIFETSLRITLARACPHDAISRRTALHFRESQRSIHAVCERRIAENQDVMAEIVVMRTRPKKGCSLLGSKRL